MKVSTVVPPVNTSAPAPPVSVSVPAPPIKVSLPAPPLSALAALLPVIVLALALPVPLIAALPVRVRLRYLLARVETVVAVLKLVANWLAKLARSLPARSSTTALVWFPAGSL